MPWTVTEELSVRLAPGAGDVMCDVGAVVSNEGDALTRPEMRANGWAPMSAKRLTVACCMVRSVPAPVHVLSRPQAHWTVPAPKTSAPDAARYMVRLWVAVPPCWVVDP